MMTGHRTWLAGGAAALAIVACANTDSHEGGAESDGGISQLPDAASPETGASEDAGIDAPVVPTRECSDDHFCHTAIPSEEILRGVWGDGSGVVWAVAESGRIFRWDGTSWTTHTEVPGQSFRAIWGSSATDIWAVGTAGVMHGTGASSEAITFETVDVPGDATVPFKAIWGTGPNDVWIVGGVMAADWPNDAKSRVVHYGGPIDDGGTGWEEAGVPGDIDYDGIWGSAKAGVWLRGTHEPSDETGWSPQAMVEHRPAGVTDWETVALPECNTGDFLLRPGRLTAGGMSTEQSIWLAGANQSNSKLYWRATSTDDGATYSWTCTPRDPDLVLTDFWGLGADDTWAVGEYGRLRHWDGEHWKQAAIMVTAIPVKKALFGIWGLGNDDFWVVGDGIALHKTTGATP